MRRFFVSMQLKLMSIISLQQKGEKNVVDQSILRKGLIITNNPFLQEMNVQTVG